jgi:hypothetical protein
MVWQVFEIGPIDPTVTTLWESSTKSVSASSFTVYSAIPAAPDAFARLAYTIE